MLDLFLPNIDNFLIAFQDAFVLLQRVERTRFVHQSPPQVFHVLLFPGLFHQLPVHGNRPIMTLQRFRFPAQQFDHHPSTGERHCSTFSLNFRKARFQPWPHKLDCFVIGCQGLQQLVLPTNNQTAIAQSQNELVGQVGEMFLFNQPGENLDGLIVLRQCFCQPVLSVKRLARVD